MSQVRMRAEGVEDEITVAEESVPFHAAAGWQVVEDEPSGDSDGKKADDEIPDGGKAKSERPRASTAKTKEQD
jgi:hypothetical protein